MVHCNKNIDIIYHMHLEPQGKKINTKITSIWSFFNYTKINTFKLNSTMSTYNIERL